MDSHHARGHERQTKQKREDRGGKGRILERQKAGRDVEQAKQKPEEKHVRSSSNSTMTNVIAH
jgi:hypothetical protein